ncbi:MAG: tetratricopeptide repeat protein [Deltaproteobacteria bacterium]|nr:tetratricopeptide repeat protein [Deltaproteobacteria bacterium]
MNILNKCTTFIEYGQFYFKKNIKSDSHNLSGLLAANRGELEGEEGAIAHFQKAVEYNPNSTAAWSNLGQALAIAGKEGASTKAFEQLLILSNEPKPEVLFNIFCMGFRKNWG